MRKITKLKRSIKAVSPVIATLLIIAIAVVASLVVYAWVTGYIGGVTLKVGSAIKIQSFYRDPDTGLLTIYVQNVGQGTVVFKASESVYVDDIQVGITSLIQPLALGETAALVTNKVISEGEKVEIKVTTKDGISATTTGIASANPTAPPNVAPVFAAVGAKSVNEGVIT